MLNFANDISCVVSKTPCDHNKQETMKDNEQERFPIVDEEGNQVDKETATAVAVKYKFSMILS